MTPSDRKPEEPVERGGPLRHQHSEELKASLPSGNSTSNLNAGAQVPASRVDRLLLQRLRKSQSTTVLYGEPAELAERLREDATAGGLYPPVDGIGDQRLIVVANRLPVSAYKDSDGGWQLQISAGGLVSALMGVENINSKWIGWPGVYIESGPERDALTRAMEDEGYAPVYMDENTCDLHYNGFCNSVLWQLFHYVPLNIDSKLSETRTLQFQWQAHQLANKQFADVILKHYRPGDIVWVQDYHLMLLPAILKEKHPRMKVGFFLHTPFPSSEIYRTLPVREELLRAVLKADLIGFHTYDYARHFVSACTRILGLEGTPAGVEDNGSVTRVAAFPIGIDPDRFTSALEAPEVRANVAQLLNRYAGRKVMLGVDRLDMIKGIPQKLLAFEKFLEENPDWRDKVLLVQIAVPSRTDVPEYQRLRSMVHEIVGRINGKYGTLTHVPIYHLDRQLSFHELVALYAITDVALVTSLRDGMNLVSYEYVACQRDNAGVLILSEFAGAAQSLGAGAILVNPWNINDLALAIEYALTMSDKERRERHRQNYMHVTIHTAQTWADTFISELNDTHVEAEIRTKNIPPALDFEAAVQAYNESKRRLLVLGYNATLTTAVEAPRQPKKHFDQIQAMTRVNSAAYSCLVSLSKDPNVDIVIFSGSEKERIEEVFHDLPVWLAAENGAFIREPESSEWKALFEISSGEWKDSVQLVFEYFCERTPRSFVEERGTSLVWNYKYADVEFGRIQARDLLQHLLTGPISNAPVDIIRGARSIEVRPVGVSKGSSMAKLLQYMSTVHSMANIDFAFVAGHFLGRDEDAFTLFEGEKVAPVKEESKSSPWQESSLYFGEENPNQFLDKIGNLSIRTSSSRNSGLGVSPATMSPRQSIETESLPLQLPPKHLFTCTVGRSFASQARYCLHGSNEIAFLLYHLCISSGIKPEGLSSPPPLTDTYHETYDI
ncbi:Alpha,alpha-trehalose-phosphate synthase [UDP-forming] 1 [Picochlorum sp. SENEW3]|nr:Alpha,alpha-trehalose-phosphate synthase [UDP-forming] 1 [Picochlorum sp. SENEW3]WPT17243.1 Alpha,alpha-trehalose-phosphate synthase [UDP-forming] 1 [Picochlorum sp. SENEW3]